VSRKVTIFTMTAVSADAGKLPLYGAALQCRVTTEDPEKNFAPDYGKIRLNRSPAGFGIRLDGGTAYAGAVLAAYYDSLARESHRLGLNLPEACQRMDRALREFAFAASKPTFLSSRTSSTIRGSAPAKSPLLSRRLPRTLSHFQPRRSRHQIASYLGDVILNGNPEVKGKKVPETSSRRSSPTYLESSRLLVRGNCCRSLARRKFAAWARIEKRLLITDTTLRDAHQSLMATRVRTHDLLATANAIAQRLPNLSAWKCGVAPPSTPRSASLARRSLAAPARAAPPRTQYLLPDAPPRRKRCGLLRPIPIMSSKIRTRISRSRHRHLSHF